MHRPTKTASTAKWLRERKISNQRRPEFIPTHDLLSRLRQEACLEGHVGCVNCIEWNKDGSLLASGSDDRAVIIWDPFKRTKERSVTTNHEGNIFSVKFMPDYCDTLVASCASDCCVKLTSVPTSSNVLDCRNCHSDRVKRLAVHEGEPNLLWSCGEDGLILQYDIREAHSCRESKPKNLLINLKSICPALKAKCLAINPVRSEMLAVGSTDIFNRVFDRRFMKLNTKEQQSCTRYFAPGHLLNSDNRSNHLQSFGTTFLSFSPNGSELLASIHAEQVYLFDLSEPWERYKASDQALQSLLLDKPKCYEAENYFDLNRKVKDQNNCASWKPVHWTNLMHYRKPNQMTEGIKELLESIFSEKQKNSNQKQADSRTHIESINNMLKTIIDCPELYAARARILLNRGWRGDYYQAMRDCCCALALDPLNSSVMKCLAEASTKLGHVHSIDSLLVFIKYMMKYDSPNDEELKQAVEILQNFKNVAPEKMITCDNNNECDMLIDHDLDHGGPLFDSDTLNSCTNIQSLLCDRNRKKSEFVRTQRTYDYTQRFCGHCNMNTDIKEANFFGDNGDFIVGGSDDGAFYIWDKKTGNIVKGVDADYQILNCVQPHPNICMLATSGIESTVKLWSSTGSIDHDVNELETRCMQNQKYISADPLEAMILMLYPDLN